MNKALIVDDEEDICDLLGEELEKIGFSATSVLTGEEALKRIEECEWRLCIVDLKLSTDITGMDVIREVRARWPKTVVVVITGYVDVGLKQEAERLGVHGYFSKPDDLRQEVFGKKIQTLL